MLREMIRKTLQATKDATFCLSLPNAAQQGMPSPAGTCFAVSADGWLVTAAHVVKDQKGVVRTDLNGADLQQPFDFAKGAPVLLQGVAVDWIDNDLDVALLKVDLLGRNANKAFLQNQGGVLDHLTISRRSLEEGEPVYSYGFPLSTSEVQAMGNGVIMGSSQMSARVTSAIIASTAEYYGPVQTGGPPVRYVVDKALNYGNSGGPIVATETGHVQAVCVRFQPVVVPQHHIKDGAGNSLVIQIPSLYGVVMSLSNNTVLTELSGRGIPIADD